MRGESSRIRQRKRFILFIIVILIIIVPSLISYKPHCSLREALHPPSKCCLMGTGPAGESLSCILATGPIRLSRAIAGGFFSGFLLLIVFSLASISDFIRRIYRVFLAPLQTVPEAPILAIVAISLEPGALMLGIIAGLFSAPLIAGVVASVYERVSRTPYFEYSVGLSGSRTRAALRHVLPESLYSGLSLAGLSGARAGFLMAGLCSIGACDPTRPGWLGLLAMMVSGGYWSCCLWGLILTVLSAFLIVFYSIIFYLLVLMIV